MKLLVLILVLIFSTIGCNNSKKMNETANEKLIFEIRETPCFGQCPVYTMKIYESGKVLFEGEAFVDKEGVFTKMISKEELENLVKEFKEANFFDFEDEYTAEMTDLPTVYTTFRYEGEAKTIKNYHGAPPELRELEKLLRKIANAEEGWEKDKEKEPVE